MNPGLLCGFAIACFFSCIAPGAAVALVVSQSLRRSPRDAMWAIAGLQAVTILKFALAGIGLAGLLAASPALFMWVRVAGALYLAWIAIQMLRPEKQAGTKDSPRAASALWQGMLTQLCNPYSAVFYLSLLPQFIEPRLPMRPQLCAMLAMTIAIDVTVLGAYALCASSLSRAAGGRGGRVLNILSACAMLAVAFRIALC